MTAAITPVTPIVPYASPDLAARLAALTRDAAIAAGEVVAMARTHGEQIGAGSGTVRHPPAPTPPAPLPAPDVARKEIFVRQNSSWREADGTLRTAGAHSSPLVPVAIAEQALLSSLALVPASAVAQKLLQLGSPTWSPPRPSDCVDLSTGKRPKPQPEHAAGAVLHSEREAVTGTAFLAR